MSDDIVYRPVLYIPESAYVNARDDKADPIGGLAKQVGWSDAIETIFGETIRFRCVVLNNLHDCPVEGVSLFANHTNVSCFPIVNDDKGKPTRPPSSAKSLAGGTATDWIDPAPNKNFASVGIWATNRPTASFYGEDIGLKVQMIQRDTVLQVSLIKGGGFFTASYTNFAGALTSLSEKRKTNQEFYDWCDDHPMATGNQSGPDAIDIHNTQLRVRMRTGLATYGTDLYIFIEEPN